MLKKCLSVLLCLILAFSAFATTVAAAQVQGEISDLPLVMVAGYSSPELVMTDEDGNKTQVWGLNMDSVLSRVLNRIVDIGKGLVMTLDGNAQYLGKVVGEELEQELEYMKLNPDGTSKYNVTVANPETMDKNMKHILENGLPEEYINERAVIDEIAGKYVDPEYIYCYQADWRMGIIECAEELDRLIEDIKVITGKDKVNLIAVSHGGQITAAYLSLYGHKQSVNNAVLTVPAIGGAVLAYDIMSGNVHLDEHTLVYYLQHGFIAEGEYEWLVEAQQLGFLDEVIEELLPYVYNVIGNFGSIWDFIPNEDYEDVKAMHLDPEIHAGIIAKSDAAHELTANMHESLQKCRNEYGIKVSIIAGTGVPSVSGAQRNSDAIIGTNDSTGALCAPYGQRFGDGYTGAKQACDDPSHDHVSPSFEIDASCAYLPEHTWFVDELFHGMTFKDDYSKTLAFTLLLTDEIKDVHSNPEYPQFKESTNATNAVFATFNSSPYGYISAADDYIIIKNISTQYPVRITSVTVNGADLVIHSLGVKELQPGKEIKLEFTGSLPQASNALMQVEIKYELVGNTLASIGSKRFNFKIMNGEAVEYNEAQPFVDADFAMGYDQFMPEDTSNILTNIGLSNFVSFIFDLIYSLMLQFGLGSFIK
ncbi:MAG: alpha/beta fold hydrolase [Clostridia bacterium]|nr:alpha/beta fold hydrolase [Clostridia bacterium]